MVVKHLPPAVKQLLTLRNPNSLPGPPAAQLNKIFSSSFNDARQKRVEKGWLTLTTCTLLTANVPPSVGHLYRFVTRDDPANPASRRSLEEAVDKVALMREAALKSNIFVGVPRTILALAGMSEAVEDDVKDTIRKHSKRTATPENIEEIKARGQALWNSIYEPHAKKLADKLGAYHPDFIGTSEPPTSPSHNTRPSLSVHSLLSLAPLRWVSSAPPSHRFPSRFPAPFCHGVPPLLTYNVN